MIDLIITIPSNEIGFIENKRSFCVEGLIKADERIPDDAILDIKVLDCSGSIVRYVSCNKKNKEMFLEYPKLVCYSDELDPNKEKLKEYGFPLLVVDDINNPYASLFNATIKAWYSDNEFKAIIINASNISTGAVANDGFDFKDDNGNPYSLLGIGNYSIHVDFIIDGKVVAHKEKQIIIEEIENQLICRFNPINHKNRMIEWVKDKNISVINDLLPGYLNPYLGQWHYHMGVLQMYRANDLCLFENAHIVMFNYLIDSTSTSYETELGYLQSKGVVSDDKRISFYYYDIGEAQIDNKISNILKFNKNEYGHICRIDELKNIDCENKYYLDRRNVIKSHFDINYVEISNSFAIMGVIKPIQLDNNDFILKSDNTYEMNDYPQIIRYRINNKVFDKYANMERFECSSIGKSVFEFYNVFTIEKEWLNKDLKISIDCLYKKGKCVHIGDINIRIKYGD